MIVAHLGYCDLISDPTKYTFSRSYSKPVVGHEVEVQHNFPFVQAELRGTDAWNEVPAVMLWAKADHEFLGKQQQHR
jgi:hypothetical protein